MIEAVSCSRKRGGWKLDEDPYYLELLGETQPVIDSECTQPVAADDSHRAFPLGPIYEY